MNNNGMLLPSTVSDEEIRILKKTGLNVERLQSKFTAVGNLISANDKGAIVSSLFKGEVDQNIKDILGVPFQTMSIGGFVQVGSMLQMLEQLFIQKLMMLKSIEYRKYFKLKQSQRPLMEVRHIFHQELSPISAQ